MDKIEIFVVTSGGDGVWSSDPELQHKMALMGWVSALRACASDEEMMSVIEDIRDEVLGE